MSSHSFRHLKKSAVQAALAAGEILEKKFRGPLRVKRKAKGLGLVTDADVAAEKKVVSVLKRATPNFEFLAEESFQSRDHVQKFTSRWIIDPLDGTTNFVRRFPMFCVSIGGEVDGELVIGVIYHPILKELYVGEKNKGATLNGKTIRVSKTKKMKDALLTTGFTTEQRLSHLRQEMRPFGKLTSKALGVRRPGSAALDLAYTARGVFDGFWERKLNAWDVAAGAVLVQEAGGKVSDFKGKTFDPYCRQMVASNGNLHPQILKTL